MSRARRYFCDAKQPRGLPADGATAQACCSQGCTGMRKAQGAMFRHCAGPQASKALSAPSVCPRPLNTPGSPLPLGSLPPAPPPPPPGAPAAGSPPATGSQPPVNQGGGRATPPLPPPPPPPPAVGRSPARLARVLVGSAGLRRWDLLLGRSARTCTLWLQTLQTFEVHALHRDTDLHAACVREACQHDAKGLSCKVLKRSERSRCSHSRLSHAVSSLWLAARRGRKRAWVRRRQCRGAR